VNVIVIAVSGALGIHSPGVVCAFLRVLARREARLPPPVHHVRVRLIGEVSIVIPVARNAMRALREIVSVLSAS
jgi:hypothetical protein